MARHLDYTLGSEELKPTQSVEHRYMCRILKQGLP